MQFYNFLFIIVFLVQFYSTRSQRRIVHGNTTTTPKPYMVYITKADESPLMYDNWICGGAIVTPSFIITSGACVEDVKFMYAVAGYEKYIKPGTAEFLEDDCISKSKKKIVFTCTPKNYDFEYDKYHKWSNIDIALVKVESPYDFEGEKVSQLCSWVPQPIELSFDPKHSEPGRDAMVLGWGHPGRWRGVTDTEDYNMDHLQYASVLLQSKQACRSMYMKLPEMLDIIDKYMICSEDPGGIDDAGNQLDDTPQMIDGCIQTVNPKTGRMGPCLEKERKSAGRAKYIDQGMEIERRQSSNKTVYVDGNSTKKPFLENPELMNKYKNQIFNNTRTFLRSRESKLEHSEFFDSDELSFDKLTRRSSGKKHRLSDLSEHSSYGYYFSNYDHSPTRRSGNLETSRAGNDPITRDAMFFRNTRRHGICQNDHGGPLITWVGSQEFLIGLASVFLVKNNTRCAGPYLYTSTQCNGAFLGCVLGSSQAEEQEITRRFWHPRGFNPRICSMPPETRGYHHVIERRISWMHHPDGPAANEIPQDLYDRPQIPLGSFNVNYRKQQQSEKTSNLNTGFMKLKHEDKQQNITGDDAGSFNDDNKKQEANKTKNDENYKKFAEDLETFIKHRDEETSNFNESKTLSENLSIQDGVTSNNNEYFRRLDDESDTFNKGRKEVSDEVSFIDIYKHFEEEDTNNYGNEHHRRKSVVSEKRE